MTNAKYKEHPNPEYRGHPFIEALPLRLDFKDFCGRFRKRGNLDPENRNRPTAERQELLDTLNGFFVPMPMHYDLYDTIHSVIQRGYLGRNPIDLKYVRNIKNNREALKDSYTLPPPIRGRGGYALIGCSGLGKTTVIEKIRALFPDVIKHSIYGGKRISCFQIPTIHVSADKSSTVKGMCLQCFAKIDELIGTDYCHMYGRLATDGMVSALATGCYLHGIGLIVLDEIQELALTKSGGINAIVSFFLHLTNRVSTPILFVGTPHALIFMREELRYIRRSSGIPEWRPMEASSSDWDLFMNELWKYQYTNTPTAISSEFKVQFHQLIKGVPEIAIELYKQVQRKLIQTNTKNRPEIITDNVVEEVALSSLSREIEALRGLEEGIPIAKKATDLPSPILLPRKQQGSKQVRPEAIETAKTSPSPAEPSEPPEPTRSQRKGSESLPQDALVKPTDIKAPLEFMKK